jgi:uncharacterized protein YlzI (FlbEa/FlbD family)
MCTFSKPRLISPNKKNGPKFVINDLIVLNLEVCISNSHVCGTMTPAVTLTVSNGASYLHDNQVVPVVGRNQRLDDFPGGHL